MTTQLQAARDGKLTDAMAAAARAEERDPREVLAEISSGRAVLPSNPGHGGVRAMAAGRAFRTKVNANIGVSPENSSVGKELCKLTEALDAGADFVMDLSVGADLADIRRRMLDACPLPLGTVPVYEALARCGGQVADLTERDLLTVVAEHASQGVDFMTIHAGLLREHLPMAARRKLGIVSRGGAILARWMMLAGGRENPFLTHWDEIMDICAAHDVTVSLGDGLRPGCLADAGDDAQFGELDVLGRLVRRCRDRGVQVMVEGPGHVAIDQIPMQVARQQAVCDAAPFYVLGPLVTDVAVGYDHIACAIGSTVAAMHGACLLCYVTPAEHLGLPTVQDVRDGVAACRIAAHAADVGRGLPGARRRDDAMATARAALDWEGQFAQALDGATARKRFAEANKNRDGEDDHCSMCGRDFCAVRASRALKELIQ